ncbi:MAG: hypothetical protein HUJ22_12875 [Gracilimonas sp.]|uniref:hypothetical protein n=1 Tax=Gracilimonas sp. TaxID=1974203 RepID=UPI0019B8881D|nr:hypothetical protein [Gracilimonas sp.]MBD3617455.1 hypothetical protein [Gracilimonas sp.]
MKKTHYTFLGMLITSSLIMISCGATGSATRIGENYYPPTKAEDVSVYFGDGQIEKEFEIIGRVTAEKTAGWTFTNVDEDKVIKQLKKEAASIGADAIIIGEIKDGGVPWAVQGAGGSSSLNKKSSVAAAIKFK